MDIFKIYLFVLNIGIAAFQHKHIILEYALQNETITYNKIKYNIFEVLAILILFFAPIHRRHDITSPILYVKFSIM